MPTIEGLASALDNLYKHIEEVRNKILAHNDRSVYQKGTPLGDFPQGEDETYFRALGQLCLLIWNKFSSKNLPYAERVFDFTKAGICGDMLCPSNEARELLEFTLHAILNIPKDSR